MKHLILVGMVGALLGASQASAVVADKFQCSLQLFKKDGTIGPQSHTTLAIIRMPEAIDPDWIDGVSATQARSKLELRAPGIEVAFALEYEQFYSQTANKAAQRSCFTTTWETDNIGTGSSCSRPAPEPHYDPTDYFGETPLSSKGSPLFRSQDIKSVESTITGSNSWSKFRADCRYLGTFE